MLNISSDPLNILLCKFYTLDICVQGLGQLEAFGSDTNYGADNAEDSDDFCHGEMAATDADIRQAFLMTDSRQKCTSNRF